MRVIVEIPEGWRARRDGDWTVLGSPDEAVRVIASPLVPPVSFDGRALFEGETPPGTAVEYVSRDVAERTRCGWTMAVTTLQVRDRERGAVELRIGAVYTMLAYVGVVIARIPGAVVDRERDRVAKLLASARPDLWSDEPACIAELFSMEDP